MGGWECWINYGDWIFGGMWWLCGEFGEFGDLVEIGRGRGERGGEKGGGKKGGRVVRSGW